MSRVVVAIVGVLFAIGFLCVPLVGPPSPNAWWVASGCAGVCLLISVACLKNIVGEIVRRIFGAAVLIGYAAYFVSVVREGRFPWGPIGGLLVYGMPGGFYAIFGSRWWSVLSLLLGGWSGEGLEADMRKARPIGFVFCQWKQFRNCEKAESEVFTHFGWKMASSRRLSTMDEVRAFGAEFLRRSRNESRDHMTLETAEHLTGRFIAAVVGRGGSARAWITEDGDMAGIAMIGSAKAGFLIVDDRYDDEWDEDEEIPGEQADA